MTDTLKKGDLVTIGRKKEQYRVKQVSPSGEGAVLVETVDAKPYVSTYVNADQLKPAKTTTTSPAVPALYVVTITSAAGAEELRVEAVDEESAIAVARDGFIQTHPDITITDAAAIKVQA